MSKSKLLCVLLAFWPATSFSAGESCSLYTSSLSFGSYDPSSYSSLDSIAQVQIECSNQTTYELSFSESQHSGYYPRKMKHEAYSVYLEYQLYVNAARTQVLGDGTDGTVAINGVGNGEPFIHTIYSRIGASQNARFGFYSDRITITVRY